MALAPAPGGWVPLAAVGFAGIPQHDFNAGVLRSFQSPAVAAAAAGAGPAGLAAACAPGGAITNLLNNTLLQACAPGGAIHGVVTAAVNAGIANACAPGGAVTGAIANACGPGGAVTAAINGGLTAACNVGGAVKQLIVPLINAQAAATNRAAHAAAHAIAWKQNANGAVPQHVGAVVTRAQFLQLGNGVPGGPGVTGPQLSAVLAFYGLPVRRAVSDRREELWAFLIR